MYIWQSMSYAQHQACTTHLRSQFKSKKYNSNSKINQNFKFNPPRAHPIEIRTIRRIILQLDYIVLQSGKLGMSVVGIQFANPNDLEYFPLPPTWGVPPRKQWNEISTLPSNNNNAWKWNENENKGMIKLNFELHSIRIELALAG